VSVSFVLRLLEWSVLRSALRHGIAGEDILHAVNHAIIVDEVGDDPVRWLVLGPDRAGNLLELVVLDRPAGPAVENRHEQPRTPQGRDPD